MSSRTRRLIVLSLVLALFCWVFGDAVFRDRNFIYRDAGHFYYPLLKLVRDEWNAGRWPLWDRYENGGMPLLANPAAAVLYPPRIVLFQWLPISYGAAFKWYTLGHVLLAAAAAYVMARHWRASEYAAGLAAMSYAFGAVVMFQYCNVIFLVGAAWVPFGLVAADRALASGDLRWAVVLGIVLAMQLLGGDPEAAYLTGGLAVLYVALDDPPWAIGLGAALGLAAALKGSEVAALVLTATLVATLGLIYLAKSQVKASGVPMAMRRRRTVALGCAAVVAIGLTAAQWLPTREFTRLSLRAAGGVHVEPYAFWIGPWRLPELLWPNVNGRQFSVNTRWLDILALPDRVWEPSLYAGSLTLLLGLLAWRVRRAEHWQRWMSLTLVLSVWAAAGPGGGPSWYLRTATRKVSPANDAAAAGSAEHRAESEHAARKGGRHFRAELETPGGGLYWLMHETLPGFEVFRYPAKLMTFAAAALAALAAAGWDRLVQPRETRLRNTLSIFAVASLVLGMIAWSLRRPLTGLFGQSPIAQGTPYYGPLQVDGAFWCVVAAFLATAVLLGAIRLIVWLVPQAPTSAWWPPVLLGLIAVDLGLANRWMVSTAPQSDLDAVPKLVQILNDAEAQESAGEHREPFRVHRVSIWSPSRWIESSSAERDEEVFRWEKDTIQPKYGLPHGVSYTINEGTTESFDYWFFFAPFPRAVPSEFRASLGERGTRLPDKIVYYPRRGYDLWGAKYFVLPRLMVPGEEQRGFLTFLPRTEPVAASPDTADDFQVLRNLDYYPRAWIVHRMLLREPIRGMRREDRQDLMEEMLYVGDDLWYSARLEPIKQNPREVAWVEVEPELRQLVASYQSPGADRSADVIEFVSYEPQRVELRVKTTARGMLILADEYFPGWRVLVDDEPQPILRANRMMRGVLLEPGEHRVVFEYDPRSFRLGGVISVASLLAVLLFGGWTAWRGPSRR